MADEEPVEITYVSARKATGGWRVTSRRVRIQKFYSKWLSVASYDNNCFKEIVDRYLTAQLLIWGGDRELVCWEEKCLKK